MLEEWKMGVPICVVHLEGSENKPLIVLSRRERQIDDSEPFFSTAYCMKSLSLEVSNFGEAFSSSKERTGTEHNESSNQNDCSL